MDRVKNIIPNPVKEMIEDHLIKVLTAGTYTTFAKAIRETVSNSYDAGASKVDIIFEPKELLETTNASTTVIQIHDDGMGLDSADFWEKFVSIRKSKIPSKKDKTTGRYPIGQFGIGALAFLPFVQGLSVYSKKTGSEPVHGRIDALKVMETSGLSYADHITKNCELSLVSDAKWNDISNNATSGTIIRIDGINEDVYKYLLRGSPDFEEAGIFDKYANLTKGLKEIMWHLSTVLPLNYEYDEAGVYDSYKTALKSINPSISVQISSVTLMRRIYAQKGCKKYPFIYEDSKDKVKATGVIIANPSITKPKHANGIMLRLNNVGIGSFQFFGFKGHASAQTRITGEIHVEGLHDELENSRESFALYREKFSKLNEALMKALQKSVTAAADLSTKKSENRRAQEENRIANKITEIQKAGLEKAPISKGSGKRTSPTQKPNLKEQYGRKTADTFTDPIDMHYKIRSDHALFKKYRGISEKETLRTVLIAMKLAQLPEDSYQKVIKALIRLKEKK